MTGKINYDGTKESAVSKVKSALRSLEGVEPEIFREHGPRPLIRAGESEVVVDATKGNVVIDHRSINPSIQSGFKDKMGGTNVPGVSTTSSSPSKRRDVSSLMDELEQQAKEGGVEDDEQPVASGYTPPSGSPGMMQIRGEPGDKPRSVDADFAVFGKKGPGGVLVPMSVYADDFDWTPEEAEEFLRQVSNELREETGPRKDGRYR